MDLNNPRVQALLPHMQTLYNHSVSPAEFAMYMRWIANGGNK